MNFTLLNSGVNVLQILFEKSIKNFYKNIVHSVPSNYGIDLHQVIFKVKYFK